MSHEREGEMVKCVWCQKEYDPYPLPDRTGWDEHLKNDFHYGKSICSFTCAYATDKNWIENKTA